jgi:hypothetical protein
MWRQSGRETEGERGGLGTKWSRVAVWHRRGSGPATACAGDVLPCDSGGRRGRRDADGVADRRLGRDGGPVISGWVRREAAW